MNISKRRDPRMWRRWREAKAVALKRQKTIAIDDFDDMYINGLIYGSNHVHVFGVGFLDPTNRYHKQFLDP